MRGKQKRRKLNNEGFSLIELLIAIVILSIIVAPLLHSFVTAARTSGKARNTMHATAIAEDVMEEFEAYSIAEMETLYAGAGWLEETDADLDGDGHADPGVFRFTGKDGNTTSGTYDVEVVLDPAPYASINAEKLADIQNLAGSLNAVYTESAGQAQEAYGIFSGYSLDAFTPAEVAAYTDKNIDIKISSSPISLDLGEGEVLDTDVYMVTAAVQFYFNGRLPLGWDDSFRSYPQQSSEYILFSNEAAVREQAESIKAKKEAGTYNPAVDKVVSRLANIIVCIQPRYGAGVDNVRVDNRGNVDTSIYLVRQNLPQAEENALTDMQRNTYRLAYKLTEHNPGWVSSQGAAISSHCMLRTNLLEHTGNIMYEYSNASNGSSLKGYAYLVTDPSTGQNEYREGAGTIGGCAALKIMQADTLTPLHSYNRMYDIIVRIYPAGTIGDDGSIAGTVSPLVTMTGTVTDE